MFGYKHQMKKKSIVLMFVLMLSVFGALELKAQTDGYFRTTLSEEREDGSSGLGGLTFGDFFSGVGGGFGQQDGLSFGDFTGESIYSSNAPLGCGTFIMTTTSILYLIAKRRKEDR